MGPYGVSGYILKGCSPQLSGEIYDVIKGSPTAWGGPTELKRDDIISSCKNANREEPLNYRPVSLTCILCK